MPRLSNSLSIAALLALSGCWWTAPPNDAGDEAFARQAIRTILGRNPRGSAEIRALARIASDYGREAAVDVLFEDPGYVTYWSNVLADDLQIQRAGELAMDATCLAGPMLPPEASVPLALHLATADPDQPFCYTTPPNFVPFEPLELEQPWNEALEGYPFDLEPDPEPEPLEMPADTVVPALGKVRSKPSAFADVRQAPDLRGGASERRTSATPDERLLYELGLGTTSCPPFNAVDIVQAAVRADRLDALYRGYLPMLAAAPFSSPSIAHQEKLGSMFLDVYLDRDTSCMGCHTTTYSTTDARPRNNNWDRFYPGGFVLPVPLDLEGGAFSYDVGSSFVYGGDGGAEVASRVGRLFRPANHTGSLSPWGMHATCADDYVDGLAPEPDVAFGGVGPSTSAGVLDLTDALRDGFATLGRPRPRVPDWQTYRGTATTASNPGCDGCHNANNLDAPDLALKTRGMSDHRLFQIVRFGSGSMAPQIFNDADAWSAVRWIRDAHGQRPAFELGDRQQSFAWLVTMAIADNIADETLGEPFVMSHGFPRNPDQAYALSTLTREVAKRFSLKDVLEAIVLSDGFNRRAPAEPSTDPYALPMLLEPTAASAPGATPAFAENANSEGDMTHRHSPAGWLQQVHGALGWPAPRIAGDATAYPTQTLMTELERQTDRPRRESSQVSLSAFRIWEQEVATCEKPAVVFREDVLPIGPGDWPREPIGPDAWDDWIDQLVNRAPGRMTWLDAAVAVKDRMLADPRMESAEQARLKRFWDVDLSEPVDPGVLETKLRGYCGVLMTTPQFLLRGPERVELQTGDPDEPVCLEGEPCGENALYEHFTWRLGQLED